MPRYFASHRAAQPVGINGRNYSFTPTTIAGNMVFGVIEASTPESEGDLAELARLGKGVEEITREEYEAEKKRTPRKESSGSLLSPRPIPQPSPSMDAQSAPSGEPEQKPEPDPARQTRVVSLASVLRTSRLNPPNALVDEKDRLRK